jgi:DNA polymerase III delta subunit
MARKAAPTKPGDLSFDDLAGRARWPELPAVIALAGESRFLRKYIEHRVVRELFGDQPVPALQRFDAPQEGDDLLARVLDELRTVSILSAERLVIVEAADDFLAACRDDLEPFLERGFAGGHLVLHLERGLDERTRFAKELLERGWVVRCKQPFDRPPPWQPGTPPWENELTRWIVSWARRRGLEIDPPTAYELQARVGTDLGVIDESLEKIGTYLGPERRRVDVAAVEAVTGELREDSIFDLVESFIAADRARALHMAEKLFQQGYHPARGAPVHDAGSIAIMFIGALVARLRPLRRAHAMREAGHGPDAWLEQRLTTRPFIERFRRELAAMPPARIERAFESLLRLDRAIKTGADPRLGVAIVLARD